MEKSENTSHQTLSTANKDCIYRQQKIDKDTYVCNHRGFCQIQDCINSELHTHYKIIKQNIAAPNNISLAAAVLTSKRRTPTLNRTCRFLKAAGITEIDIYDDSEREEPLGIYGNWLVGATSTYIKRRKDWYLIIQDDIFISNDTLSRISDLDNTKIYSLFAPENMAPKNGPGWYTISRYYNGPNCLLIPAAILEQLITSKTALRHCIARKKQHSAYDDLGIFEELIESEIPISYHYPNFTIHWAINSTHNKKQYHKKVLSKAAIGTYTADLTGITHKPTIKSTPKYTPEEIISIYHEKGNVTYHCSTGEINGEFTYDPKAYYIEVKEEGNNTDQAIMSLTDRVFWTK